jgi:hypothetical protein
MEFGTWNLKSDADTLDSACGCFYIDNLKENAKGTSEFAWVVFMLIRLNGRDYISQGHRTRVKRLKGPSSRRTRSHTCVCFVRRHLPTGYNANPHLLFMKSKKQHNHRQKLNYMD